MKLVLAGLAVASLSLAADFQYTSRTEITGGSMKQMMAMIGRFSKAAGGPTVSTTYIKGGKMATTSDTSSVIMDADAGTMTMIDTGKKEYSVITFEEMLDAMQKASAKMQGKKTDANVKSSMRVDVKEKGPGKSVQGVSTKNLLMTIYTDTVVKDEKSGKETTMTGSIENDMHIGKMPGSEAFTEFSRKMAGRYPVQQMPMQAMMQGGIDMKGLQEAGKKMAEVGGIPLYSVARITNSAMAGMGAMPPPQQQSNSGRTAGDVARDNTNAEANNASNEAANAAANSLGRFGGLIRRNKPNVEVAKKQESAPAPAATPAPASSSAASNTLMELTTEVTSFSAAAVDPNVFQVPAGFKQVENPMKKMAK